MRAKITCFIISLLALNSSYAQNYDIYVSDAGNFDKPPWQILKFDSAGKNPQVFIKDSLNWPQDILFLEDINEVLISNLGSGKINRHHSETGEYLGVFADNIGGPTRMAIGPDSFLYVLQWTGDGKVLRFDLNGTPRGAFSDSGVVQAIGLCWDHRRNLYVTSYQEASITKFDSSGNYQTVFTHDSIKGPTNIFYVPPKSPQLIVVDYRGGGIARFDMDGKFLGKVSRNSKRGEGIAMLRRGGFLLGDGNTSSVQQYITPGKMKSTLIASGSAGLKNPNALVIRPRK